MAQIEDPDTFEGLGHHSPPLVVPAKAGTHLSDARAPDKWTPSCDGVTPRYAGVEKIAVLLDMRGEPQRVLARQPLGEFGVAAFERLDDPHMIDDRAGRAVVLMDRDLADRPHVDEQIFRHLGE